MFCELKIEKEKNVKLEMIKTITNKLLCFFILQKLLEWLKNAEHLIVQINVFTMCSQKIDKCRCQPLKWKFHVSL